MRSIAMTDRTSSRRAPTAALAAALIATAPAASAQPARRPAPPQASDRLFARSRGFAHKNGLATLGASPAQLRAYTKAAVVGIGEIVLWIGYATGARVNARCKGPDQKEVDALVASFANS